MGQERTLSLVIPAKDEEANIATLLTEAYGVMRDYHGFEVVLVDDGSTDSTLDTAVRTARALGGRLLTIRHERSIGQKETQEWAVMVDTFRPLKVTQAALDIEIENYHRSWLDE